ncbi:MAG: TolC family protein [Chloroflexota bacterium]
MNRSRSTKFRLIQFAALYLLISHPVTTWCQQSGSASTGEVLTLDRAVTLALENNRQVKNAALEVGKSEDEIAAFKTKRLPSLKLDLMEVEPLAPIEMKFQQGDLGSSPTTGPIPPTNTTIRTPRKPLTAVNSNITQPLSQLYRIGLGIDQLEVGRGINQEELRSRRHQVIDNVKRAYYGLLQTQSSLEAVEESIKFYRELDQLVEEYVRQQTAFKYESLDVKTRLAKTETDALTLRNTRASEREQLNRLLARDVRTEFRVAPVPEMSQFETDLAAAQAQALRQRPELSRAQLQIKYAEYDYKIKRAEYIPDVNLVLNYSSPITSEVLPRNIAFVGLQLSWEYYDWGRKSNEMAAKSKSIEQAKTSSSDLQSQVLLEVSSAYRKLQENRAALRVAQLAQETQREMLRVTLNKYKDHATLLKDVLQVQAASAGANNQYQHSLLSLWTARADFEKAIGEE